MDREIKKGNYKGQKLLYIMAQYSMKTTSRIPGLCNCPPALMQEKNGKHAEVFATWFEWGTDGDQ